MPIYIRTSVNSLQVPEGEQATFNVRLSSRPRPGSTRVSVARSAGDASLSVVSGDSLTFNRGNYNRWQTVTVAAAEDGNSNNGQATFRLTGRGLESTEVTVAATDNV